MTAAKLDLLEILLYRLSSTHCITKVITRFESLFIGGNNIYLFIYASSFKFRTMKLHALTPGSFFTLRVLVVLLAIHPPAESQWSSRLRKINFEVLNL